MDEAQSYIIVWNDAGYPRSLVYHDLAEGNTNDFDSAHPRMLAYRREQLQGNRSNRHRHARGRAFVRERNR